jgi:hypothetical protein
MKGRLGLRGSCVVVAIESLLSSNASKSFRTLLFKCWFGLIRRCCFNVTMANTEPFPSVTPRRKERRSRETSMTSLLDSGPALFAPDDTPFARAEVRSRSKEQLTSKSRDELERLLLSADELIRAKSSGEPSCARVSC